MPKFTHGSAGANSNWPAYAMAIGSNPPPAPYPYRGSPGANPDEPLYVWMLPDQNVYTVAAGANQLPSASANPRMRTWVSDALLPVVLSLLTGGGTRLVPVYSDGTSWYVG